MKTYDLIILGGGPAGYRAAERAGAGGMSVLLIEEREVGGVCLNEGCIPSKALLNCAKIYEYALHGGQYGVNVSGAALDQRAVIARKNKAVATLVAGVKASVKSHGAELISARGEITGRAADGFTVSAGGDAYSGKNLLIATGSTPVIPPIPGVAEGIGSGFVLTNREILDLEEIPGKLVIIGGGVIGLEMASYYNSAGASVTVVEMLDHIAPSCDAEVSSALMKVYADKGINFKLGCRVTWVRDGAVQYEQANGGGAGTAGADKVLLSIGRRPVTSGFGLERLGVWCDRGAVKTDLRMRTNIPGVYAAGDVNGVSMLAHTAYREAEVAVNNMLGIRDTMRYGAIPSVIYTNPEAAGVGHTEEGAAAAGIKYKTGKVTMMHSGRFVAENLRGPGLCKILAEAGSGRIIGAHAIGPYASEFIAAAAIMLECELNVSSARELVFPHPTVCEVLREALFALKI